MFISILECANSCNNTITCIIYMYTNFLISMWKAQNKDSNIITSLIKYTDLYALYLCTWRDTFRSKSANSRKEQTRECMRYVHICTNFGGCGHIKFVNLLSSVLFTYHLGCQQYLNSASQTRELSFYSYYCTADLNSVIPHLLGGCVNPYHGRGL